MVLCFEKATNKNGRKDFEAETSHRSPACVVNTQAETLFSAGIQQQIMLEEDNLACSFKSSRWPGAQALICGR
jgi:hypothetical protein